MKSHRKDFFIDFYYGSITSTQKNLREIPRQEYSETSKRSGQKNLSMKKQKIYIT